ncbi:MAG: VPS10 domain-containing protein [Candidatus Acidiferrales bacterium]
MMAKSRIVCAGVAALLLSTFAAMNVFAAQDQATPVQNSEQKPADVFANLKFRDLGPAAAGGRVAAVAGVPGNPNIYYVGAAGGGVFKSVDGGLTWKAIFAHESTASIGAIAVAASNPNYVWVGTGEGNIRNDLIDGHGVYFSADAGNSWKFMGLASTQQISDILVDPNDPNTVFVGALGHAWGPNADRGVFKTTNGGKTWKKILYVNDSTGVSDLEMASGNSDVLFACMWQFRRYPWTMMDGGPDSAIYRSTDGGDSWKKLTKGLPKGPLGRSAVAIAPSDPNRIYALIAAKHGMLWQSNDMGDSWTPVSDNHALDVRPFYFTKLVVSPDDENKVYFMSFNMMESNDGGKNAFVADRGVHSDHHTLWIDPKNPGRMIMGTDGGAYLSTDGAKTWRFLDGMPIEQFYMVAADSRQPYDVCGGLQDNSSWCGPSSDLSRGRVTGPAWYTVVGGDGEYAVPAPSNPNIIYTDSQDGSIQRLDLKNHLSRSIEPYLQGVETTKPADLKYRFNWTAPIAVSPTDANEAYLGGNVVFKTTDGGKTWTTISGDLTRNDKSKQEIAGGPVQHDISGAESYDTILSITLAPTDPKVIWVGTDDGLVQVTRDGGKSWKNVAPNISGAPQWARVYQVGVSPFDAGTAYVAYDAHELDNRGVYVYRTSDYGATWQKITDGLPDNTPVRVVREDPNQRGFLVAGTDTGLFYSSDRGDHWQALKSNFPTASVYDVQFKKADHDLLVATHGRGILILDDIRPLEQFTSAVQTSTFHVFTPQSGVMYHMWRSDEGQGVGYFAPNAPNGAVIDYYLKSEIKPTPEQRKQHQGPVKIVVTDDHGNTVATDYGPGKEGINRFVWTMQYAGATMLKYEKMPKPNAFFNPNRGPRVAPGTYKVSVTANGQTESQSVTVEPDPNLHIDPAIFRAEAQAGLQAQNEMSAVNEVINRIDRINKELKDFRSTIQGSDDKAEQAKYQTVIVRGHELEKKLTTMKDAIYNPNVQHAVAEDDIHELTDFHGQLNRVVFEAGGAYGEAPNALMRQQMTQLFAKADQTIKQYNEVLRTDIAGYNKTAESAGAPTVFGGSPITVKAVK